MVRRPPPPTHPPGLVWLVGSRAIHPPTPWRVLLPDGQRNAPIRNTDTHAVVAQMPNWIKAKRTRSTDARTRSSVRELVGIRPGPVQNLTVSIEDGACNQASALVMLGKPKTARRPRVKVPPSLANLE